MKFLLDDFNSNFGSTLLLPENRTLLERDFSSTSFANRFFDQSAYSEDPILHSTLADELNKIETKGWCDDSKERAKFLLINNLRDCDFNIPIYNVSLNYLRSHYSALAYLKPTEFRYYSAAIIISAIKNTERLSEDYFLFWVYELYYKTADKIYLIDMFDRRQIIFILSFVLILRNFYKDVNLEEKYDEIASNLFGHLNKLQPV